MMKRFLGGTVVAFILGIAACVGTSGGSTGSTGHKGCKCGDSYISCTKTCHK